MIYRGLLKKTFNDNLLAFNKMDNLFNSSIRISINLLRCVSLTNILELSAYIMFPAMSHITYIIMSFMYIINNKDQIIDP